MIQNKIGSVLGDFNLFHPAAIVAYEAVDFAVKPDRRVIINKWCAQRSYSKLA